MACVEERKRRDGSSCWRVQVRSRAAGKSVSKTFESKKEAENWAYKMDQSIKEMKSGRIELCSFTLQQFLDRYSIDHLASTGSPYSKKQGAYLKFWGDRLGSRIASEITGQEVENVADSLYSQLTRYGTPTSSETRRKYVQTLHHVYKIAIRSWKWAVFNPVSSVDLHHDAIKESRGSYKEKVGFSVESWKKDFLNLVGIELQSRGIDNFPGVGLSKFTGISKTSLQKIYDSEGNVTLVNLLKFLKPLGFRLELVKDSS